MASLENFRAYARIDEDDRSAESCYMAAVEYAKQAGVPEMGDNWLYDLLINAVALHFYDNRGFSPGYAHYAAGQGDMVERWITRLKMMLQYAEGGTNGGT